MTVADTTRLTMLPHAVLRVAAWPVETAMSFAAPRLAAAARELAEQEAAVAANRPHVLDALHAAVPKLPSREARAYLLAVKRHVHGCLDPLPQAAPTVAKAIHTSEIGALLAEERTARESLAAARRAFAELHDRVLAEQQASLAALAWEPRFRRALVVSAPSVAARWRTAGGSLPGRSARDRRLEATLFDYLMRACGRPTPNGVWAGVAPLHPGDDQAGFTVGPALERYDATPDLYPFAVMLAALAAQPRYREGYALRLNPTLTRVEGSYRFERWQGANATWATVPAHPLIDALVQSYSSVPPSEPDPRLRQLGLQLGLLESDLALDPAPADVWTALDDAIGRLVAPDQSAWREAVGRIRDHCRRLSESLSSLSPDEVEALRQAVNEEIAGLWQSAGLLGTPPGAGVLVDMRAPFTATWGKAARTAAESAMRQLFAFHAADGGAELYRLRSLAALAAHGDGATDVSLTELLSTGRWQPDASEEDTPPMAPDGRAWLFSRFHPDAELRESLHNQDARWQQLLAPVYAARQVELPPFDVDAAMPGPAGALLLSLDGEGTVWLGRGRPQPGLFVARFVPLLRDEMSGLVDALRSCAAGGVPWAEVAGRDPASPNAGVRPRLAPALLDPHDTPLQNLLLHLDPRTCRPWLTRRETGERLLPIYNSGVAIGHADPCSRMLLLFAFGHGWEFVSFGFPALPAERDEWGHLPRLTLAGGAVLSPERWTLDRETVARLCELRGAARYRAWRAEAEGRGLPSLALARCGPGGPELLLPVDSPLAVRCFFDTHATRAPFVVLSELPGDPTHWPVQDAGCNHYMAEIGVTWQMQGYERVLVQEAG